MTRHRTPKQTAIEKEPAAMTYEQKVDQIQKEFAELVALLRSHGIHLKLDEETGDVTEDEAGEEV